MMSDDIDKANETNIPTDILAFVAEVEARVNDATPGPWNDDNGYRVRREDGEVVAETKHCEGSNSYDSTFIASARDDVSKLIAIVREQTTSIDSLRGKLVDETALRWLTEMERDALTERLATLESPDGENLYDGCLCGEISPEDKPCLTCAARLSQWDAMEAELALRRKRRFIGRHEEETGVYHGDYNQHRETGWACNACGVFSGNEHDACENCDNDFIRIENENAALRKRLAKLESIGPWIEAERAAEQELADKTDGSPGMCHAGRASACEQIGKELNNRAGKDLRKESTNEPVG